MRWRLEPVQGHSAHEQTTDDPRSFWIVLGVSLDRCTQSYQIGSKSAPQKPPLVCRRIFFTLSHAVWASQSFWCFAYYRVAVFTRPRQLGHHSQLQYGGFYERLCGEFGLQCRRGRRPTRGLAVFQSCALAMAKLQTPSFPGGA